MNDQCCENCRFWIASNDEIHGCVIGMCRKNPPVAYPPEITSRGQLHRMFPKSFSTDWCGEWHAKEGATSPAASAECRSDRP